ncbi:hypothetical protein SCLCIDRAFT_598688 [Scleroderma citrinum Foug A]|uniref:COP9 signalosome complex subunit 3 n=1 Tax=Scleroderma citrinum Foug A TaxID=1036808 RepID=A0A0C2ZTN0_9AGAM|nr:hypothetical protein SCLCIDRAFT_598688 [Scleroderma citrinum Foug A]
MSQTGLPSPPQQPTPVTEPEAQPSPVAPVPPPLDHTDENDISLHNVIAAITTATSPSQLNHNLKTFAPKEVREVIFASFLPDGQDPLSVLDIQANTLGILYILSARLHVPTSQRPPLDYIEEFCKMFVPEQARYAPERVTSLATGIAQAAEQGGNLRLAIQPLFDLLVRYSPTSSHLTTIHPIFLRTCVSARFFNAALPILAQPITTIDLSLSDLTYNDNLVYHYTGGVVYTALRRWAEAEEFFEICACSPGTVPAAIQLDALIKLVLVQLIREGKTSPPPKYIHPSLPRLFKGTPYSAFVNAYPKQRNQLRNIVETEQQIFAADKNLGLINQALEHAARWSIRKLTGTYLTLHISDIGQAVGIDSEDEVRALILDMIQSSEICARISTDGTVMFSDPPVKFDKADIDRVLAHAQEQCFLLTNLEREMARSKEYLAKFVKSKDDSNSWLGGTMDEDLVSDHPRSNYNWAEDVGFI